ncbi:hypothetical protein JCM8208_004133 [Rhodotorula glutinis]
MSLARSLQRLTLAAPQYASSSRPISHLALAATSRRPSPSSSSSSPRASTRSYASEATNLGNLAPHPGSSSNRKRIGRGIGSGRGGTSGRGHKGQGARSGNSKLKAGFEGGQTPLTRAFPKRGFTNPNSESLVPLNLERLQHWIDRGLIDPTRPITMRELYHTRCVHGVHDGVKLLADGAQHFTTPGVQITVTKASDKAIQAVEKLGGTLVARYENRLTLRALIRPESFFLKGRPLPGKADPVSRRHLLYYSDPTKRGYLALEAAAKRDAGREGQAEASGEASEVRGEQQEGEAAAAAQPSA